MEFLKNFKKPLISTALILAGLLAGFLLYPVLFHAGTDHWRHQHDHSAEASAQNDQVWTCSMHPQIRQDGPGKCPICGMDLIPASSAGTGDEFTLAMTPEAIALAGVHTGAVERSDAEMRVRMPGRIVPDERRRSTINANVSGRITNQRVSFVGQVVGKGDVLATIWSPELVTAQQELIEAVRASDTFPGLAESVREKLRYWGLSDNQIREIENSGEVKREISITAPAGGTVTSRLVNEQSLVSAGQTLYEIDELSNVWADFEASERNVAFIRTGGIVRFRAAAYPGQEFAGRVSWVDPNVDNIRQTVRVRLELDNTDARWKPDMFLDGELIVTLPDVITIPESAILWTGTRSIVYVQLQDEETPTFESRVVETGQRAGTMRVILSGLETGERVVTNGAFKVDAEFQLRDKFSMMNRRPGASPAPTHSHSHGHSATERIERETIPSGFRAGLNGILDAYLMAKDALFRSDASEAHAAVVQLDRQIRNLDETGLPPKSASDWLIMREDLRQISGAWTAGRDIEQQREHLFAISEMLYRVVNRFQIGTVVYRQFCPMAFDDTGATWLSSREQIENPYLPESMPGCGEVLEVIR